MLRTTCTGLLVLFVLSISTGVQAQPTEKKLIEYGWDVPAPSFVADNIRAMEERPFDGLIMRVQPIGSIFTNRKYEESQVAAELQALGRIEWKQFTDNFIIMYAASTMDWFSDADWDCVVNNVRLCAKAARIGRCKGLCFDAEPYGNNPWIYPEQAQAGTRSFAEYQTIVRKRGAQFVDAIEAEMQTPVIHTFFLLSYFGDLAAEADPAMREAGLINRHYGLLPAFIEGMLDAADPGTVITDGNESSYYYTKAEQFEKSRDVMRDQAWKMLSLENQARYPEHVQVSQALYVDHLFDLRVRKNISEFMTPEERALWFEHNVYYALSTADRYVWLYSERMNWWLDRDVPELLPVAIRRARAKLAAGEPLGFDLSAVIEEATERRSAMLAASLVRRSADVAPVPAGQTPAIDGVLDDPLWRSVSAMEAFVPYIGVKPDPKLAATLAWAAYDQDNLYIACYCYEPNPAGVKVIGSARDHDVWNGDSVDLFLSAGQERKPYYHLIVNPEGVLWDAACNGSDDLSWSPDLHVATHRDAGYWSVELSLPWKSLTRNAPVAGQTLYANLCRQRITGGEQTCWSQCVGGFVEPDNFGLWTFR